MMVRLLTLLILAAPLPAWPAERLPVIDIHLHALAADSQGPPPLAMCTPMDPMPRWDQAGSYSEQFIGYLKNPSCDDPVWSPTTDQALMEETLEVLERLNIIAVASGPLEYVKTWRKAAPERIIPGISFNLAANADLTPETLRGLFESGEVRFFGEITNQYSGIEPDDERMAPYWTLAEELDIPAGIHVGTGPPGVAYLGSTGYRARLHSALTMEEVLISYPRLRIFLGHAGYPMLDDLLAVMYAHPQVYVGVGVITHTQPRAAFYRYLKGIVDAGFGDRVMFGSDQMVWPGVIERAIAVINEAPFLSEQQKRDILYNNAARFLRLDEAEIARHHGM